MDEDAPVEEAPTVDPVDAVEEPTGDTPSTEPVEAAPEDVPASWTPTREEWEAAQAQIGQLSQFAPVLGELGAALAQANRPADPLAGLQDLDPLDPTYTPTLVNGLAQVFGQILDERLGPVQQVVQEREQTQAQSVVDDWLSEAAKPHGDLVNDQGRSIAEQLAFGVMVKTNVDGHTAVNQATDAVAQLVKQARSEGRQALLAEQKAKAEAGREPSGGGSALGVEPTGGDELDAVRRLLYRRGIAA